MMIVVIFGSFLSVYLNESDVLVIPNEDPSVFQYRTVLEQKLL